MYALPAAGKARALSLLTGNWFATAMVVARSGFPFNAQVFGTSPNPTGHVISRPDRAPGLPSWVSDPTVPGGQKLNIAAFPIPSTIRQGTEGRNDIPGFGLTQVDTSLGRDFVLTERFKLQFRADAFNLFNHPNFANPFAFVEFGPSFLVSPSMLNSSLSNAAGGLNPLFQQGGPRSLQLSLKFLF
jgi:hypothetical protein